MTEGHLIVDVMLGALILIVGFILKRIFILFDKHAEEDKLLHSRITDVRTEAVSRTELQGAVDRVLARLDKLEEKLLLK